MDWLHPYPFISMIFGWVVLLPDLPSPPVTIKKKSVVSYV
jgi:hypothetical protein